MATTRDISEITKSESELFNAIRTEAYQNICLMKIRFNGYETSCICVINEEFSQDGFTKIEPLAILVNRDILDHFELLCPKGLKPGVKPPS